MNGVVKQSEVDVYNGDMLVKSMLKRNGDAGNVLWNV